MMCVACPPYFFGLMQPATIARRICVCMKKAKLESKFLGINMCTNCLMYPNFSGYFCHLVMEANLSLSSTASSINFYIFAPVQWRHGFNLRRKQKCIHIFQIQKIVSGHLFINYANSSVKSAAPNTAKKLECILVMKHERWYRGALIFVVYCGSRRDCSDGCH